jgi:hypothetical protein
LLQKHLVGVAVCGVDAVVETGGLVGVREGGSETNAMNLTKVFSDSICDPLLCDESAVCEEYEEGAGLDVLFKSGAKFAITTPEERHWFIVIHRGSASDIEILGGDIFR